MYKPVIGNLRAAGQIVSCMIHNCLILIRNRKVKKKKIAFTYQKYPETRKCMAAHSPLFQCNCNWNLSTLEGTDGVKFQYHVMWLSTGR